MLFFPVDRYRQGHLDIHSYAIQIISRSPWWHVKKYLNDVSNKCSLSTFRFDDHHITDRTISRYSELEIIFRLKFTMSPILDIIAQILEQLGISTWKGGRRLYRDNRFLYIS